MREPKDMPDSNDWIAIGFLAVVLLMMFGLRYLLEQNGVKF